MTTRMCLGAGTGELGSRRMSGLGNPLPAQDLRDRPDEDLEVERKRATVHVFNVEGELLFPRQRVAPAHLRQAGDSRPKLMTSRLLRRIKRQVLHQQRSRSDHTHVAAEHVQKLWQF